MTLPRFSEGRATIGPTWLQGRTAYGGASAAIALQAAKSVNPDLPPLRSAQIAFVGPLSDTVTATPQLLRRGRNSAFIGVDVVGSDGLGLRALFLFMTARDSAIRHDDVSRPPAGDPDADGFDPGSNAPGFLVNFELAAAGEAKPGDWRRWVRLKERDGLDPEVELIAIADALPPAALSLVAQWGPISTTAWQLNVVGPPVTRDGWWLLEAQTLHAADGTSSQAMTIWNRDGAAVATATQSVAVFV